MNGCFKQLVDITRVHARFSQSAQTEWIFEIREGDGNDGEYKRGTIVAKDAFDALLKASRTKMICKTPDVRINADIDGDGIQAHVASYVRPIFGDACRWSASASLSICKENEGIWFNDK